MSARVGTDSSCAQELLALRSSVLRMLTARSTHSVVRLAVVQDPSRPVSTSAIPYVQAMHSTCVDCSNATIALREGVHGPCKHGDIDGQDGKGDSRSNSDSQTPCASCSLLTTLRFEQCITAASLHRSEERRGVDPRFLGMVSDHGAKMMALKCKCESPS